jgi:hypothetical protein
MVSSRHIAASLLLVFFGCEEAGRPPAAPATPPSTLFVLGAPTLVEPADGAAIPQNNPNIGCAFVADRGYGFATDFTWTAAASSAGVESYHLFVKHPDALNPLLDTQVQGTHYTDRHCNAYVTPQNLEGWQWRVQAIDARGTAGPWSESRTFRFQVCRVGALICIG